MKWSAVFLALALTTQVETTDVAEQIRLPAVDVPVVPKPTPPPPPVSAVQVLNKGERYCVEHTGEVFIRQSPKGVLSVKALKGPVTISGTFFGSGGEEEDRTFAGPFVYVLRAASGGTADVFFVPKGCATDKQILTRTIEANLGPRPPPTITVPSFVGLPQANAEISIVLNGLTVGTVSRETNSATAGTVTRQAPVAGSQVAKGSAVALVVSTGAPVPPPVPVDPSPFPEVGLRCLIVYETGQVLPESKTQILFSKAIRDYLDAKCVVGPKNREWRIYDPDIDLSGESKTWQDAMKRPRKSTPWILIGDGAKGFEGPLPETTAATLELLQKFGG